MSAAPVDQPRTPAVSCHLLRDHLLLLRDHLHHDDNVDNVGGDDCNDMFAGCGSLQRTVRPSRVSSQEI